MFFPFPGFNLNGQGKSIMPIYEFTCPKCKAEFEDLVRGPKDKVACPECGSKRVTRKMSVFGFKSGAKYAASSGGSGCAGCSSNNCSTCK